MSRLHSPSSVSPPHLISHSTLISPLLGASTVADPLLFLSHFNVHTRTRRVHMPTVRCGLFSLFSAVLCSFDGCLFCRLHSTICLIFCSHFCSRLFSILFLCFPSLPPVSSSTSIRTPTYCTTITTSLWGGRVCLCTSTKRKKQTLGSNPCMSFPRGWSQAKLHQWRAVHGPKGTYVDYYRP